jgi:Spy/CpxP family protein refolding chaperone
MVRYPALIVALGLSMTGAAVAGPYRGHTYAEPHPHPAARAKPYRSAPPANHVPPPRMTPPARPDGEARPAAAQFPGRRFIPALGALNLNPEQRDRIRSLVDQTRQANQNADPETRRQNIQKMRNSIWQTLTPEQQSQFRNELTKPSEDPEGP